MSFSVRLYEFSKKENSTARPSGTGTEYDCILVRDSGVLQPVIELKMPLTQDPAAYNYAYIPAFERYYFISEWKFQGALWHAHMIVDALATWRGTIGSQSFYVLRSSAQKDGSIMDTMYPVKDTFSISTAQSNEAWFDPNSGSWLMNGYFIVGILSYNTYTDAIGGVNYYAMLPGSFNVLMQEMFKEDGQYSNAVKNIFDPISNYSNQQKANMLYVCENPYNDYIKTVTWVPNAPVGDSVQNSIYLGKTQITGVHYKTVNIRNTAKYRVNITIPKHPLTNARGSYVNLSPYTEMYLSLPKLGLVELDPSYFAARSSMAITLDIDPITGEGLFRVYARSGEGGLQEEWEIARWYAPIGVSIAVTQGKELGTRAGAIGQLVSAAFNAITNPGSIAALPAAIANVERAQKSTGATLGNNGGWLGLQSEFTQPRLICIFHDIAADDNAQNGRPLCQVKTPASLGGYMMVQDADIQAPATSQELAAIKQYMEAGFYYE